MTDKKDTKPETTNDTKTEMPATGDFAQLLFHMKSPQSLSTSTSLPGAYAPRSAKRLLAEKDNRSDPGQKNKPDQPKKKACSWTIQSSNGSSDGGVVVTEPLCDPNGCDERSDADSESGVICPARVTGSAPGLPSKSDKGSTME
jgi:hypothetical protein